MVRTRVAKRVLESLLRDPQYVPVAWRVRRQLAVDVELDLTLLEPAQQLDVLGQRAAEAVALEVGRAQLEDERTQFVACLLRERLELRDLLARRGGITFEQHLRCLGAEHEAEELLTHGVVEVEC